MKVTHKHQTILRLTMVLLAMSFLVACQEKDLYGDGSNGKLDVENLFDFSTAQTVTLNVKYDVDTRSRLDFEIYTQNPLIKSVVGDLVKNQSINPVFTGKATNKGLISCTINIPSAAEKLYIYSPNAVVPTLLVGDIIGKQVNVANTVEDETSPEQPLSRASTTGSYYKNWPVQTIVADNKLGTWDSNGLPTYLLGKDIVLTAEFKKILSEVLPADDNMSATAFQYKTLTLQEEANVDMYFVSHAATARHNALAYYTFTGAHPKQADINKSLTVIFPDLSSTSLKEGNGVRLKYRNGDVMQDNFPKGSTIGWVLLVDAYKTNKIENPCNAAYSWNLFNGYDFLKPNAAFLRSRPHMGAFRVGNDVVLSFEDQPWGTGKPANFRDDVFVLKMNPITALPDDIVDPNDPAKLKSTQEGIYLFEDNWPERGDYDLNDIMVKYVSTFFYDEEMRIFSFEHTFNFVNNGASYQNAFGFQMGDVVKRENIKSCEIDSDVSFTGMGLDSDLDVATFMVFDNGRESKDKVVKMKIKLKSPVLYADFMMSKGYNPFIVVNGLNEKNRREVHVRNFKPTAKADMTLFGRGADLSVPSKGLYYVSNDNYPFALDVRTTDEFRVPIECEFIENTYPQFTNWAESNGAENKEWYKHPIK